MSSSSEDEAHHGKDRRKRPWRRRGTFKFFEMPSELRRKIYLMCLRMNRTIDLSPLNIRRVAPRLQMLCTCRQMYEEAWPIFYGQNQFRLFPTDGQFHHTSEILLRRIPSKYRNAIQNIELRLGPSWTSPPRGWNDKPRNKLRDLLSLRTLNLMLEVDPSGADFRGFRVDALFYTDFCTRLLKGILQQVPSIEKMNFDGWPSVQVEGELMKSLLYVALDHRKQVSVGLFGRTEQIESWRLENVLKHLSLDKDHKEDSQLIPRPVKLLAAETKRRIYNNTAVPVK